MLVGYARVSSLSQNLSRQLEKLEAEGCQRIYQEKASGKDMKGRPELEKAIESLRSGDILVIAEWDRATRSMYDGLAIMQRIVGKGALIKVLDKSYLDLTTALGQGLLAFLSALAQDERERINKRAADGRRLAKARGQVFGRKHKLSEEQRAEALKMLDTKSSRKVALVFGVSHVTIARLRR